MQTYKALLFDGAGHVLSIRGFDCKTDAAAVVQARGMKGVANSFQLWRREVGAHDWSAIPDQPPA